MTKIIWMSDPHFQAEGTIRGLNPRTRLAAAIDHMNAHHADADLAIMSGDLVGDDIAGDYAGIAEHFSKSMVPLYAMVGNNDDRAGLRQRLTLPDDAMADFVQYALRLPDCTLICLDTHMVGSHAGQFCDVRRAWLDQTLTDNADKPAYIFMHHPPLALGLPKQDEIMLEDGDSFLALIAQYKNVKHLFMGHVHRPTCGVIRGIPFATIGALSFQAPPPRQEWDWDSFHPPAEPPHYGVLHISGGDATLQYTQFCAYETGIES